MREGSGRCKASKSVSWLTVIKLSLWSHCHSHRDAGFRSIRELKDHVMNSLILYEEMMPEETMTYPSGLNQGDPQWEPVPLLTELRCYVYRTKGHSEPETCKASAFAETNQTEFT